MAENNKNRPEDEIATEDFFEEELSAEDTAEDTAGEPAEELDPVLDQYLGDDGAMPETAAAVAAEREDEPSKNKGVSRRVRFGAVSLATTLIVVAAVVVFNILAGVLFEYYPLRLYLNKDNVYTLSEEAKEVARSVQEKVTIVAFQAETEYTAPNSGMEEIDTVIRQFYEGVNQCILASGGNISVEFFDPAANPARAAKYKEYDADRNSILFLCGDRFDLVKMNELIYFDEEWQMAYYMGQAPTPPPIESMVEKVLTTSLLRVTADLAPVVLFTGHGEDTDVAAGLVRTFGNNGYEAVPHDITTAAEIPPEAVTAVILAPQVDFNESEIIRLRDWLRNDGMWNRNLILFASPWDDCPLLFEFIGEEYNLEITSDLIVETKAGNIYNNSAFFSFGTVTDTEFTARIAGQRALSPLPRRIIPKRAYDPEANFYTVSLVDYGETARTFVNSIDIESYDIMDSTVKAEAYPISAMAYAHKRQQARDIDALVDTYVMVVGAEEFLNPNITANIKTAANETLFMSVFNAISGNTTGAIITSRMINNPSIQLDAASASWLSILFVGVLPIGTLAAGLVVFLRRRHL